MSRSVKLVALITDVNQTENLSLIGSIVVVDSKLKASHDHELCYMESEHGRSLLSDKGLLLTSWLQMFELHHSVSNLEIIGVL